MELVVINDTDKTTQSKSENRFTALDGKISDIINLLFDTVFTNCEERTKKHL